MADTKAGLASNPSSEPERVRDRTKEEFDEAKRNPHQHHKETHGLRPDIDEQTPIRDVKAPNVFERVKEEFAAIVQAIHPEKERDLANGENRNSDAKGEPKSGSSDSEKSRRSPNLIEKAKDDNVEKADVRKKEPAHRHHRETHGTSNDIDENTPMDEVKGPSVFERAKEEVEALLDAIHPKKKDAGKEGGFRVSIRKGLEKICSPRSHERD